MTGFHEMHTLYVKATELENIKFYDEWFVTSLIVKDHASRGLTAIDLKTGNMHIFQSKATIIATGGYARV